MADETASRTLLTGTVRVLSTSDLLLLMQAIVAEFQRRWDEVEPDPDPDDRLCPLCGHVIDADGNGCVCVG